MSIAGVLHGGLYVSEVKVDVALDSDELCDGLYADLEDIISKCEGLLHCKLLVGTLEKTLVGENDK